MFRHVAMVLGVLSLLAFLATSTSATYYVVTQIPNLGGSHPYGGSPAFYEGINNHGVVVGYGHDSNGAVHPFLWSYKDGIQDLGVPPSGGTETYAYGVNDDGQVVGRSITSAGSCIAFRWTSGTWENLGTFGDTFIYDDASGINNSGQVVGYSLTTDYTLHGFLYDDTLTPPLQDVHDPVWAHSMLVDVNNSGQAVGRGVDAGGVNHPIFCPSGGTMTDLGTFGGLSGEAMAINDNGQVVGMAMNTAGQSRAFLWTSSSGKQDLGTLGGPSSWALDINASGQVVGWAKIDDFTAHAAFFTGGIVIDLNTKVHPDWGESSNYIGTGLGINGLGQIVASTGGTATVFLDPAMGGDANLDGSVNGTDLNAVLSNYNQTVTQDVYGWMSGDFNDDGSVNGTDLNAVLSNYNQSLWSSSAAAVPEPSTLLLALAAVLSLWGWKKKFMI